jgi:hypothetical protein
MDQYMVVVETKSLNDESSVIKYAIDNNHEPKTPRHPEPENGGVRGLVTIVVTGWQPALRLIAKYVHWDLKTGIQQWY